MLFYLCLEARVRLLPPYGADNQDFASEKPEAGLEYCSAMWRINDNQKKPYLLTMGWLGG